MNRAFWLLLWALPLFAQQNDLLVRRNGHDMLLPIYDRDGTNCIQLNELATAVRASRYTASGRLHFLSEQLHLQVMPRNPFILINGDAWYTGHDPGTQFSDLYLPLTDLDRIADQAHWRWDPAEAVLEVDRSGVVQGFRLQDLEQGVLLQFYLSGLQEYEAEYRNGSGYLRLQGDFAAGNFPTVFSRRDLHHLEVTRMDDELNIRFALAQDYRLIDLWDDEEQALVNFLFSNEPAGFEDVPLVEWQPPPGFRLDRVVIDPGHGGRDPGAISPWGAYEKDVTLAVSLELRRLLNSAGIEVVMTRDSDRFLSLQERTQLANREKGKLFVSIHCNSSRNRRARGFEVFLLRPARNERALAVALKENQVISLEQNPASYEQADMSIRNLIVMTMAQSAHVQGSAQLASRIKSGMRPLIRPHGQGINQAGFYVLWGASMPAVLVELGFLSNRRDYNLLVSSNGQKKLARALYESIMEFQSIYETD